MLKIGLTGGVASGKSIVASLFEQLGVPLIDTDVVAREVVEPGQTGLELIQDEFGSEYLTPDGRLDRRKLRAATFADSGKRRRLEAILHPWIRACVQARLEAVEGSEYVIVVVPLLLETDFHQLVDRVLVVDVPIEMQIERLMTRDGSTRAEAQAIIAAQAPRETRLAHADDVIDNSGSLDSTRAQVEALHRRYLQLATVCREESGRAE